MTAVRRDCRPWRSSSTAARLSSEALRYGPIDPLGLVHTLRHARLVSCHARLVEVRPDTGPADGAAVHLSAVEVRALWNILGLVAAGGSLTEKPEREMARRLQAELALSFHRRPASESPVSGSSAAGSLKSSHWTAPDFGQGRDPYA
jgi:hypothetical protein